MPHPLLSRAALSGASLLCLLGSPVMAETPLLPRAEISLKGGNKRSLLTTELWAPIAQRDDRVLYADLRLMGDNDENREGNFGLGYREINPYTNTVIGFHGWIDQRRTENNSTFRQLAFGAESLGHVWDMRVNGYVPLDSGRALTDATVSNIYLSDTGLYQDINGFPVEIPQYGFDAELGYRLPALQRKADTIRIYGGAYHFFRSNTQDVTGFRIRGEAQVNSAFSVGARYQYDEPRGSQGFLDATLKFPFGAKKLYQSEGLRARLDESPERDVDIVTSTMVTPNQNKLPVINIQSGDKQRVIHVDNSNTDIGGGDGSKENPFTSLAAAQSALRDNDVIYIHHGNGSSAGMDTGIVINKANILLAGSGADFVWDNGKFGSTLGVTPKMGMIITKATSAPVITNTDIWASNGLGGSATGNGVYITDGAYNTVISGIAIQGASGDGIYAFANGASENLGNITISHVTASGNAYRGINVEAWNSARIGQVSVTNTTVHQNTRHGIQILADNGIVGNITLRDVTATQHNLGSGNHGIFMAAQNNSTMGNVQVTHSTVNNNNGNGIFLLSRDNSITGNALIHDITAQQNTSEAVFLLAQNDSRINNIAVGNITSQQNSRALAVISQYASAVGNIVVSDVHARNASAEALFLLTDRAGDITLRNIDAQSGQRGISMQATNAGHISLSNIVTHHNSSDGVFLQTNNVGNITLANIQSNQNGADGLLLQSNTAGNVLFSGIVTGNNGNHNIFTSFNGNTGNIAFTTIAADQSNSNGLFIQASGTGGDILLQDISVAGGQIGMFLNVSGNYGNAVLSGITGDHNREHGILFQTGGSVNDITLHNISANANANMGFMFQNYATAQDIHVSAITGNNNGDIGLFFQTGSSTQDITLSDITVNGNSNIGLLFQNYTASGNIRANNITANNNTNIGVLFHAGNSADSITLSNVTVNDNDNIGLLFQNNAAVKDILVSDVTGNGNTNIGAMFEIGNVVENIDLSRLTVNQNGNMGLLFRMTGSADTVRVADIIATDNLGNGIAFEFNNASLNGFHAGNITASGNAGMGVIFQNQNSSAVSATLSHATITANGQSGIFVNSKTPGFNLSLGETMGYNRLYNNNRNGETDHGDLRLGLNGASINAHGNWWGQAGGPVSGQIVDEDATDCPNACGTATITHSLDSDRAI